MAKYVIVFCYIIAETPRDSVNKTLADMYLCLIFTPKKTPGLFLKKIRNKKTVNFVKLNLPNSYSPPPTGKRTAYTNDRPVSEFSSSPESLHVGVLPSRKVFWWVCGCLDFGDHVMGIPISNRDPTSTQNGGISHCHLEFLGEIWGPP